MTNQEAIEFVQNSVTTLLHEMVPDCIDGHILHKFETVELVDGERVMFSFHIQIERGGCDGATSFSYRGTEWLGYIKMDDYRKSFFTRVRTEIGQRLIEVCKAIIEDNKAMHKDPKWCGPHE